MNNEDKRQKVGLFYSYTPEKACFLGWARMSAERVPVDAETRKGLAIAGKFDGQVELKSKGKKLKRTLQPAEAPQSKAFQHVFEFQDGTKVYEQECWSASEHYTNAMLGYAPVTEVDIEKLRQASIERTEMAKDEARVLEGFVQIGISFKLARVDHDEELEDLIIQKLLEGKAGENPFFGCSENDIEVKVRSDEEVRCSKDPSHGPATEILENGSALCPECQAE